MLLLWKKYDWDTCEPSYVFNCMNGWSKYKTVAEVCTNFVQFFRTIEHCGAFLDSLVARQVNTQSRVKLCYNAFDSHKKHEKCLNVLVSYNKKK